MINLKKSYFLFSYQMDFMSFQIIQGDILQISSENSLSSKKCVTFLHETGYVINQNN